MPLFSYKVPEHAPELERDPRLDVRGVRGEGDGTVLNDVRNVADLVQFAHGRECRAYGLYLGHYPVQCECERAGGALNEV